jgi:hypothetical protein
MATTYLTRTPGSAGNRNKWTLSGWVKRSQTSAEEVMFSAYQSNDYYTFLRFEADGTIKFRDNYTGSANLNLDTNAVYRDTSAWYHVVAVYDKDNATSADKAILYINGERVTSFSTATYPSQSSTWNVDNIAAQIGSLNTGQYWNGSMAMVQFVDGQAYDATYFGSTDSTTGIWTPQASSTISSYGTNGFKLKMDTATPGADTSGNTNTFTVGGGTPTLTQGSPSNVFATFNPLDVNLGTVTTFSNGNTTVMHNAGSSGSTTAARSTLAYSAGKFYWETKCIASGGDVRTGIISMSSTDYNTQTNPFTLNECYNYKSNGDKGSWGDANSAYGATYTAGDIIGIAHDVSAGTLIFYKNGVSQGTAFTGLSTSLFWGAFSSEYNQGKYSYNFGEGFFGTTAAGTQADDNGQGLFAYDVPAGYYALNTKNLEAYG